MQHVRQGISGTQEDQRSRDDPHRREEIHVQHLWAGLYRERRSQKTRQHRTFADGLGTNVCTW